MKKNVNISIVTFNRLEYNKRCIESVLRYTDYPHVITVIDNCSQDGTRDFLKDLKSKGLIKNLVLLNENIGGAKASNIGWLLEPSSEYYLKLDNDIVVQKSPWLSPMVETIEKVPVLGAVAYNVYNVSHPLQQVNNHWIRLKHDFLHGSCILIPKRTEKLLGYWCEDYGLYGQDDVDYGVRIQLTGLLNAYMQDEQNLLSIDSENDKEYRKWKEEQIDYIGFVSNVYAYFKKWKSLFCYPNFAMKYLTIEDNFHNNDVQLGLKKINPLIENGNYNEAIEETKNLLKNYPGFAFLHQLFELIYRTKGDETKALYHQKQAKLVNPYIDEVPPKVALVSKLFDKIYEEKFK